LPLLRRLPAMRLSGGALQIEPLHFLQRQLIWVAPVFR
jgi:hypothetical protein